MTSNRASQPASQRIVVGVTGASGSIYAQRLLEVIPKNYEIHLVVSDNGEKVAVYELGKNWLPKRKLIRHQSNDFFAPIASGSFKTEGMIIVPCSMGTIGGVANGISQNLLQRAADVCLKERRKLVLVPRETPYSTISLENMLKLSVAGATILDANPPFYQRPKTLKDIVDAIVGRILDQFEISHHLVPEWKS